MKRFLQYSTNSSKWVILIILSLISIFSGCGQKHKLKSTIKEELNSGIRNDSLFLGLEFGITKQEFYDRCWLLNRQGLVKEGPENMSVEYIFKDSLDQPIAFNFYADINSQEIHMYNASFYYYGWAPWNKHLQSDVLLEMLPSILMDWYGGNEPFVYVENKKKHYFKIDGNRLIHLYIRTERFVGAEFIDLSEFPQYPEGLKYPGSEEVN